MEKPEQKSEIQTFYKDKVIFITGASGFMGKVLIEKLLYACSDLNKIYILIRPKRARSVETRVEEMFKLPLFQRIRNEKPQLFKKVIPLNGDILSPNLGLFDEQCELLANEVNIVFHSAATLRLEAKLKDAVDMNLTGTKRILDLAKQMKYLKAFVHISTAFCHVDQEELGERTYDSPNDPQDIMRLVQWLDEDAIDLISPKLLHPHPNTYTYSKRLAETLVANEFPKLPCVIARPSIVTPSLKEPMPGWVDNLNGPTGLIVGAGKGVIRSMHCNGDYHAEVIPVDIAINNLIVIAFRIATNRENMVRIQKRISVGLEVLQYFTTREWIFHNARLLKMDKEQSPMDKKLFPTIVYDVNIDEYLKYVILGSRQYCMKEDLSTLPKARRHQKIMYIIHITTIYLFYFGVLYFIYNNFGIIRLCLECVTEVIKSLPLIGTVIQMLRL
ncbi:putative fatty acyl-CoA reductase CG5065 isoform X2 [Pogonomyrmex barbatus]|uniref:Fatty acyl-CoA reductase n=1 Tax=Pogonomyrmex barbatus TaxID=144034 RepID=A0A6I9W4P2_9HYME|nr:putative fatty acyl-CoA reductase CG5065 isoform X2 [Pogonomyrmex barbatus]